MSPAAFAAGLLLYGVRCGGSAQSEAAQIHEAGHGVQNCLWGVLFPFIIGIPSLIGCAVNPAKHSS